MLTGVFKVPDRRTQSHESVFPEVGGHSLLWQGLSVTGRGDALRLNSLCHRNKGTFPHKAPMPRTQEAIKLENHEQQLQMTACHIRLVCVFLVHQEKKSVPAVIKCN